VDIITKDKDGIFKHRFWHLKSYLCAPGDLLSTGDVIGVADSTGRSTGNHLHRGLKPQVKDKHGNYRNEFPDNGFFGAIDQGPYLNNIYVRDYMINLTGQVTILQRIIYLIKTFLKSN